MKIERQSFQAEVKEFDEKDLTVVHFISTEKQDRGRDILYAGKNERGKGMFMGGRPVVMLQHGWNNSVGSEPIAKPVWVKPGELKGVKGIQAKTQFFPDELGKRLWQKTVEGYMPNWSVGWRPIEGKVEIKTDRSGAEIRYVYEWELLEYSLVSVPMQPDAQTLTGKEHDELTFKLMKCVCSQECSHEGGGCSDEKWGEVVGEMNTEDEWDEKPYPNFHACRLEDPKKYVRVREEKDKFGKGIYALWGIQKGDKPVELQAIRFSKSKFTPKEARAWIKEHKYKCIMFEPASEKCEKCGKPMLIKWDQDVMGEKCGLTCEAPFQYVHDGECGKKADEACSCDGEADDKAVCKTCKKPKPSKEEKREIVINISSAVDLKAMQKYLASEEGQNAIAKLVQAKQMDGEESATDPCSDEDVSFMMVDADQVLSDNPDSGFEHGGHHYTFDFIPESEIWIDQRMTDEDIMQTKCDLFMERECMKYCEMTDQMKSISGITTGQAGEMGDIAGRAMRHLMDPNTENGGHHDGGDTHWYEHSGNHWHNRGQTVRWDSQNERHVIHAMPLEASLTKDQKEAFEKDIDEAIKVVAVKYGLQKPVEPEAGKDKKTENPPEPRKILVINSEEDKKKAEEDRKKQLAEMLKPVNIQIDEMIKKIPEIVHEEIEKFKGRVN